MEEKDIFDVPIKDFPKFLKELKKSNESLVSSENSDKSYDKWYNSKKHQKYLEKKKKKKELQNGSK